MSIATKPRLDQIKELKAKSSSTTTTASGTRSKGSSVAKKKPAAKKKPVRKVEDELTDELEGSIPDIDSYDDGASSNASSASLTISR